MSTDSSGEVQAILCFIENRSVIYNGQFLPSILIESNESGHYECVEIEKVTIHWKPGSLFASFTKKRFCRNALVISAALSELNLLPHN